MMSVAVFLAVFRMVVLPVQFEDRPFAQSQQQLRETVAQAEAYFRRQYGDAAGFQFDIAPVTTLAHPLAWYGANDGTRRDIRLHEAVREAVEAQQGQINFALYDNDADGKVDNVCLLSAGRAEDDGGGEDALWPQMSLLSESGAAFSAGSKRIDRFTLCPEGRLGIFCHETAHVLGLPDFYGSDAASPGLWGTSLMDEGCRRDTPPDFDALAFDLLGLGSSETLAPGHYELRPLLDGRRYLKAPTATEDEYFLFGVRDGGLLVYHIDRSDKPAGHSERYGADLTARERWEKNVINENPEHPCARLMPANPDTPDVSGVPFPQSGVTVFASDTPSAFRSWDGRTGGLALTDIRSLPDGSVAFDVLEPILLTGLSVYQDAATVRWKCADALDDVLGFEIVCRSDAEEEFLQRLGPEAVSFTLEGLQPRTDYTLSVRVLTDAGALFAADENFVTKVYREGSFPYIYLNNTTRNVDGTFPVGSKVPLRVFNATDVQEVRWTFDGRHISPEADGNYTLQRSGRLAATIIHTDGTSETLLKEITLQ